MLLAFPFAFLWTYLSRIKKNPNSPLKMGVGLLLLGFGFVIFGFSAREVDLNGNVPMFYLFLGTFVYTVGELFLSPIGLSKMTELAPKKFIAFIMGVWFLSSFYGHFFAGKLAQLTTNSTGNGSFLSEGFLGSVSTYVTGMNPISALEMGPSFTQLYSYVSVYTGFGVISVLIGLIALAASPFIKRLMGGIN
jgi:POT family proton-dependent oligopeptide transporter